ncbi:MAG: type 1 glutamine amidotransferase domain-containing protein [Desulfobacterales bacterium]|nr:type 1 glutamine amidotransferase domain-containing protein [Desulfobacterales bacterium]
MRLEGKTIGILVGPGYEDLEFWVPYMRVMEEGAQVRVIAAKGGETYTSKSGGLTATSEIAANEITANQLDALLVPGGWAPDKLRRDPDILQLVREMNNQGKILGFICHAGWVAASAGICEGMRATGSTGIKDDLENAGAIWTDEPAFRENNMVWGRVVADIPIYCRELIKALQ